MRGILMICVAALATAMVSAGCGSGAKSPSTTSTSTLGAGELLGCVPACGVHNLTRPGVIGPGSYKTVYFFGGKMRLAFPGAWTSNEDSAGEFEAAPHATPQNDVLFWEDVYPTRNGNRVKGVPLTAAGLLHWLRSTPALTTSAPRKGRIGSLPATLVDVGVSDKAKNEDPSCPTRLRPCVSFLGFPQWDGEWGIA